MRNCLKKYQRGEIATVATLLGLGVLVLGIVAGGALVRIGTRLLPRATTPSNLTVILPPVEDTYVSSEYPTKVFGSQERLRVEGTPRNIAYLKFDLRNLQNSLVTSAKLFLRVTNPTDGVLFLRRVGNLTWQEELVTYKNRLPVADTITSFAGSQSRETITVDITQATAESIGSMLSFSIETDNRDGFTFYSKEEDDDADKRPRLVIVYTPLPTLTPTLRPTLKPSPTPTSTITPSPRPTVTPTPLPTAAPDDTPTPTPQYSVTPTPTLTPTATLTVAPTITLTPTPTQDPILSCEGRITSATSDQYTPSVSGSRIVWADNRNGNPDIYLFDLSTNTEKRITDELSDQLEPVISGSKVIWVDWRDGNADLYAYDLTTDTENRITGNIAEQIYPSVFGNRLVWQDYRNGNWDIYMYDFGSGIESRITTDGSDQTMPDISAERIVWEDRRYGQYDIYAYDLATSQETRITSDAGDQYTPATFGKRIVWRDHRNGNVDIWAATVPDDLTGKRIVQNIAYQSSPVLWGDRLVWEDYRNGNWDIYLFDFVAESEYRITQNNSHQREPDISDALIVWGDRRAGNYDIYAFDITCGSQYFYEYPTLTPTAAPTLSPTITPVPPSPTPTPDPNCLCLTKVTTTGNTETRGNEECHSSCVFDKHPDIANYADPIQCELSTSTNASQEVKNEWCRRVIRTRGDANGDAQADLVDFDYYRRLVFGDKDVPADINADFNGDGEVGYSDLIILRQSLR